MDHVQFTLWKHHTIVAGLGRKALRVFFPFFLWPLYYALFGAQIGKNVAVAGVITDPLLVIIEDYAVLGHDSIVTAHAIVFNRLILKQIRIRRGATVGINSVIMPGVEVCENSIVAPGSVVTSDTRIPPNEFWGGVPAKKIRDIIPPAG